MRLFSKIYKNGVFSKYLSFLEIGTEQSQTDIFEILKNNYSPLDTKTRFIVLTLNMDYMDTRPSRHSRIEDQLLEVEKARSYYPDLLFPFVGVDPRYKQGTALKDWVAEKITRRAFFGIKLYPSFGFYPFDPRLDEMYAWAEENEIPIMTHCTRYGVYYTGDFNDVANTDTPPSLNPQSPQMNAIYKRVRAFRSTKLTNKNTQHGCNIFLHPENYLPVLEKYSRLKICFAHFGGSEEIMGGKHITVKEGLDTHNWYIDILSMLKNYSNTYTDISYSLYDDKIYNELNLQLAGEIGHKILFGTDFFMVEQEEKEKLLWNKVMRATGPAGFDRMAKENNGNYLSSRFFNQS